MRAEAMDAPFLELRSIGKTYPGVTALQGVSLDVARGEVVGLIGENGAGKSTLMKVLGGVVPPSSGSVVIDGVERPELTVTESMAAGIAFVHQELNLFENLSVAANIFIGREPLTGGPLRLVDTRRLRAMARPLLERPGVEVGPGAPARGGRAPAPPPGVGPQGRAPSRGAGARVGAPPRRYPSCRPRRGRGSRPRRRSPPPPASSSWTSRPRA